MRIRQMQRSDIEVIYESGKNEEVFRVSETPGFWEKEQLYRWVENPDDVLLVAEHKEQIIGYVMSQLHRPTGKATLENIYVEERYRKKGIGSTLIEECLKQLKARGATYACGLVKTGNESVIEFLESAGFNRGYNFAWMEKSLHE